MAAVAYATLTGIVVVFQLALALGAPWGAYAMGGAFPGRYPPSLRALAVLQVFALSAFAVIVLSRAKLGFRRVAAPSRWLIWIVVTLCAVSLLLNLATPSAGERAIWAPVALGLLTTSLWVAISSRSP
jgi:hypothetical protein